MPGRWRLAKRSAALILSGAINSQISSRSVLACEVMRRDCTLVEERKERRKAKLEALRATIQEGLESGPVESFEPGKLVEQIKARGREIAGKHGG